MSSDISKRPFDWTSFIIGVIKPPSIATATDISVLLKYRVF